MAAATGTVKRSSVSVSDSESKQLDNKTVSVLTELYHGVAIWRDTNAYGQLVDDTARHWYEGYLNCNEKILLKPDYVQGQARLNVTKCKEQLWTIDSTVTAADFGKTVFIKDDNTCSLTPTTYGNILGHIVRIESSTEVWVSPIDNPRGGMANGPMRGGQLLAATGAVALTALDLNTVIRVRNTAGQTVTLPAATALSYGDKIHFVKYTGGAFALTINGNSVNINGSATFALVDADNDNVELTYLGATIGWIRTGGFIA